MPQTKNPSRSDASTVISSSGQSPRSSDVSSFDTLKFLYSVIEEQRVTSLFQPIIDLHNAELIGYEGSIRGPSDSWLHAPEKLLKASREFGVSYEMEMLCWSTIVSDFYRLDLKGALFIKISPDAILLNNLRRPHAMPRCLPLFDLPAKRIVIELSDNDFDHGIVDWAVLCETLAIYRSEGFKIEINDLGDWYSGMRRWSELRPHFVKIDRHFIQNIDRDPVKAQFVRSVLSMADKTHTDVLADGIETQDEMSIVQGLGVHFGQGAYIGRPVLEPSAVVPANVVRPLLMNSTSARKKNSIKTVVSNRILFRIPAVSFRETNDDVFNLVENEPFPQAIAVIDDDGCPMGLISRHVLIERLGRPYRHELYGRKSCTKFMDPNPLIVDKEIKIQELSFMMAEGDNRHLTNGFIVVENGKYLGLGTGHDLMREITKMQIIAARYANPLTGLPGNVPINEHISQLLESDKSFCICYCDLDHFKPFNDVYGYNRGDNVIQLTANVLTEMIDPNFDFLGHIGGDDFIAILCGDNWLERCELALKNFEEKVKCFFSTPDLEAGGYVTENRKGEKEFHCITSLSIGVVEVQPEMFNSALDLSVAATESKKKAKKIPGNSLYVNERAYQPKAAI
ncbi:MAG: GGDEF domain-containing protein [Gallionella sp.]